MHRGHSLGGVTILRGLAKVCAVSECFQVTVFHHNIYGQTVALGYGKCIRRLANNRPILYLATNSKSN